MASNDEKGVFKWRVENETGTNSKEGSTSDVGCGVREKVDNTRSDTFVCLCGLYMLVQRGIQESIYGNLNKLTLKSMWNNYEFDFAVKNSIGSSRGIVAMWYVNYFSRSASWEGEGYLAVLGNWLNITIRCLFIIVYAPQDQRRKRKLWYDLDHLISAHNSFTIVLGDFNEVRSADE
ncbi:Endonuclease/exonuclease/phosphatase [Artemisia annua]|uniref:Endonuclease/exonuclease/phosphatase n=1 Tax=Artemisia annua TaxID=35608 RepID=A0A2U1KT65_ARTAN|nr:Endonuclease/exonuclease/phosphatase [Artemisia annua]